MEWTIERIVEVASRYAAKVDVEFDIPVFINGRLTRTLGRVFQQNINGTYVPTKMEISRQLLQTATDESIESVISHEVAHFIVAKQTGEKHGHDEAFKLVCAKIGCTNDGYATKVERTVEAKDKYEVFCPKCGKISGYSRMCKTLKYIDQCYCKRCNNSSLTYVQNW